MSLSESLITTLKQNNFNSIIDVSFSEEQVFIFDFSEKNKALNLFDIDNVDQFTNYIKTALEKNNCKIGVGGYLENRIIYKRSKHFGEGNSSRVYHLGVDLWADAETKIFAPLDGKIHSFKVNNNYGDYGPTIILEHNLKGNVFYTLYGHLSLNSLKQKKIGMKIKKREAFAELGNKEENGHWAPHLHFQLMTTMLEKEGDFPGVAAFEELDFYKSICLNPNLILKIEKLEKI